MSFLYPAFLFALASIAVPVIIHLFNFRRYKTIYFPSTKFLKEVKEKTDSRSQLKHLLVLLCRILAITFLVLAFAQPYIKRGTAMETAGRKTISVFIDNSFSMGQTAGDVPLLEIAKKKAEEIVSVLNDDDLFQLLTHDFEGRQQRLIDKQEMLNQIRDVKISPATRSLSEVINRQKEAMQKGSGQRLSYVVSDFQENFSDISNVVADTTLSLNFIPLRSQEASNVYIDTCWFQSPVQTAGQPSRLFVRLVNESGSTIENRQLTLKINDQIKAIGNFSVDPAGIITDTLTFNVTDKGWNRAELSITDHPITFDDTYYLTYEVAENVNVMVINENFANPFLDALFGGNDFFRLQNIPFNQLKYEEVLNQQFVILNEIRQLSSGLSSQLKTFLEQGGSVAIFLHPSADLSSYNSFLSSVSADMLSGFIIAPKNVISVNTRNPVFSNVFQRMSETVTLPKASAAFSFSRGTLTGAEPLLICNDGSSLLTKYAHGRGLLYVCAVPLNKEVSDLPLSAVFAPMMYNMAIVRAFAPANSYLVGGQGMATVHVDLADESQVLQLRGHDAEFIPAQRKVGNSVNIFLDNNITQSAFYELTSGGQSRAWFAMNYNRKESGLTFLSDEDLEKMSGKLQASVISNVDRDLGNWIRGEKGGMPLWKVSVIFALLFLAAEIALLKLWK